MFDDRGQAYTLEAFIAALLLISSLTFALQVTAVTPLSASTANQHIENQQRASASGLLAAASENGSLKDAVLYWNASEGSFHEANTIDYYTNGYPAIRFGNMTNRSFGGRGLAVNVFVHAENASSQEMVYQGAPSDNAASASRTVTLYDDDVLRDVDGDPGRTLSAVDDDQNAELYVSDEHPGQVFNVVRVEVVVWRM